MVLEIILGREILLKFLPQTEREIRRSPIYRQIKLDVWAQDMQDAIHDTEVQKTNTKNLPRRSRHYQSLIDSKLLQPGEVDFNTLNDIYIIIISPFDLFGLKRYRYTFRMKCDEENELRLEDGAVRIFLNTRGENYEEVNPELTELLRYMEHTTEISGRDCKSGRIKKLQERVQCIKSDEEVGVKYMQAWEEREIERIEARAEGLAEGIRALIKVCMEFGVSQEDISGRLMEEFSLTEEETGNYLRKYWNKE